MGELQIRPLAAADLPAVEAIAREVVASGEHFAHEDAGDVMRLWTAPSADAFAGWLDGELVGSYVVMPVQPGRGAHVANAAYMVAGAARGRGVGGALGEHSLETARALGYRAMQFNLVVATNEGALALWRRLGFRTLATLPRAFRHATRGEVDAYLLWREL